MDQLAVVARMLREQGASREAEPLFRLIVDRRERNPNSTPCDRAAAAAELAGILADLGQIDEATTQFQKSIADFRRCAKNADLRLADALLAFGAVLRDKSDWDTAERNCHEAVEIRKAAFGPDDPRTTVGEVVLADVYRIEGRQDAIKLFEQSLDRVRRSRGERHPDYAFALGVFGASVAEITPDRSRTLLQSAIAAERALPRQKHPQLAADLYALGRLELEFGTAVAAEPLLLEALDIQQTRFPTDDLRIARTRSALGEALTKLSRFKEAEPLLRKSLDTLMSNLPPFGPDVMEARQRLIDYFDASGQPKMAEIYRTHP